jgi:sugar porter (SP) family MFS transporter
MIKSGKSSKRYMYLCSFTAAMGGLLFGFDTAVISGIVPFITEYFHLSDAMLGWAVSSAMVGCIIGSMTVGRPGDKFGRKLMLKILAVLFVLSSVGSAFSNSLSVLVIYRFIGGLAIGGSSVLAPLYISEISPAKIRGRLVGINQLAIVTGILCAFFSNYLLIDTGINNWRWMFMAGALPAALFFILLFFISPSPRWLVIAGRTEEVRDVITRLNPDENADIMLDEIRNSIKKEVVQMDISALFRKPYLRIVLIGISVMMFAALTGVNTLMYYAPTIFQAAGFSNDAALFQTIFLGTTNLVFTIIGMLLIDRIGRKVLLMAGAISMSLFLLLIFLTMTFSVFSDSFLLVWILGYQAAFASTMGVVVWVLVSEMFPNNIRARALSVGSFTNWVFNALISYLFPVISGYMGKLIGDKQAGVGFVFAFYAFATFISFFFYRIYLVETKEKSLEELEKIVLKY